MKPTGVQQELCNLCIDVKLDLHCQWGRDSEFRMVEIASSFKKDESFMSSDGWLQRMNDLHI